MQKLKLPSDKNPNSIKNIKIDIKKELNNITNKSSKFIKPQDKTFKISIQRKNSVKKDDHKKDFLRLETTDKEITMINSTEIEKIKKNSLITENFSKVVNESAECLNVNTTENNIKKLNDKETCTNLIAIPKVEKPSIILSLRDKKENSSNYKICRICYENETEENKLISPCLCQGSVKYVHESCLKTWINNQINNPQEKGICEICKFKYWLKFTTHQKFSKDKSCQYVGKLMSLLIISIIIITIIGYIVYIIVSSSVKLSDENKLIFTIIIILICIFSFAIILYCALRNYKEFCYDTLTVEWHIMNFEDI